MINLRMAALLALVLPALGVGVAVAMPNAGGESGPEQAAAAASEPFYEPEAKNEKVTITEGLYEGAKYSARTFVTAEGNVCLEIVGGPAGGVTGSCAASLSDKKPTLSMTDETPGRSERLVVGLALPEAKVAEVHTATRNRAVTLHTHEKLRDKWFAFTLNEGEGEATVVVYDSDGDPIQ